MPEWSSVESVTERRPPPNPVETFYYSRAVEKARGLSTDTLYPLSDLVNWLPGSKVIDQSTGEPGQSLSKYAKAAIKDELQYFGVDHWAQNQIDLGREYFKPQELLDYLREQGDIPFRLRTSFADAPDTGGYDVSDEVEWTREYGNADAAATLRIETPTEQAFHDDPFYRDWGVDEADPSRALRATDFPYMNEGFVRGVPFDGSEDGYVIRARLFQDPPSTPEDILAPLLEDENITEPWKEEWQSLTGEIKISNAWGSSTVPRPRSTGIETEIWGTPDRPVEVGTLTNQTGGERSRWVIDNPTYSVFMSTPPMSYTDITPSGNTGSEWYWQEHDIPPDNVAVNFDLSHLTNKMNIPWKDVSAGDNEMTAATEKHIYKGLSDTSIHADRLPTGFITQEDDYRPTNETILLQAINQALEGNNFLTVDHFIDDDPDSIYNPKSLIYIRNGLGYNNWNPGVLRNAVSEGKVRVIPSTPEGVADLEGRLVNYFGDRFAEVFSGNQPIPAEGVTQSTLGYVSRENAPGVFTEYNHVSQWDVQFKVPSTPLTMKNGTADTWVNVRSVGSFDTALKDLEDLYQYGGRDYLVRSPSYRTKIDSYLSNINRVISPPADEAAARAKLLDIFDHVRQDLITPKDRIVENLHWFEESGGRMQRMTNTGGFNPQEWESYYKHSPLTPFVEQRYRFVAREAWKKAMQEANPMGWRGSTMKEMSQGGDFENYLDDPDWRKAVTNLWGPSYTDEPEEITDAESILDFNRFWSRNNPWHVQYGGELSGFNTDGSPRGDTEMRTYDNLNEARQFANTQVRDELEAYYPQGVVNLGGGEFTAQWQGYTTRHGRYNASIRDGTEKVREVLITVGGEGVQPDALHFNWDYATEEWGDEGANVRSAYFGTDRLPPMIGGYPIDSDDAQMWRGDHELPKKFPPRRFVEGVEFSGRKYPPIYKQMGHWSTTGRDLPGEHNLIASMLTTEASYEPVNRPIWKPTGNIKELFISEMQGDVHQFGSAYGYGRTGSDVLDIPAGDPDFPQLEGVRQEDINPLREPFTVESHRRTAEDLGELAYHQTLLRSGEVGRPYRLAPGGLEARQRNQPLLPRTNPSSWVGGALIEAVRFGVENNYDYITWPVGEEIVNKWHGVDMDTERDPNVPREGDAKKKYYDSYMPKTARQLLGVPVEVGPHENRGGVIMMRIPIGDPEVKKILMEFFKTQGIPTFAQTEQPRQVAYA